MLDMLDEKWLTDKLPNDGNLFIIIMKSLFF